MKRGRLEIGAAIVVAIVAAFDADFAIGLAIVALVGLGALKIMHGQAEQEAVLRNEPQIQQKKQQMEKVMVLLHEKGELSNNDIEKLLGVSDATATRYLSELEAWGHVEQIPDTGRGVVYRLKKTS